MCVIDVKLNYFISVPNKFNNQEGVERGGGGGGGGELGPPEERLKL